MGIFDNIDFDNLPLDFNEASVREEIITPILNLLGYSAFDKQNCIIREPSLEHPFTQFGTKSSKVKLIPDYLITVDGKNAFILEAKAPNVDVVSGESVEQAYSYSIHKEVHVNRFVLCNGICINIFDIDKNESVLCFLIANASEREWGRMYELLSPAAFRTPNVFNYKFDYGLWCIRRGIMPEQVQIFDNCHIIEVARLSLNELSIIAIIEKDEELMANFDFDDSLFEVFMEQVPNKFKETVRDCLNIAPFKYVANSEAESFTVSFVARLTEKVIRNDMEDFLPLEILAFTFK